MLAFFLKEELRDQSWQIEQSPEGVRKRFNEPTVKDKIQTD